MKPLIQDRLFTIQDKFDKARMLLKTKFFKAQSPAREFAFIHINKTGGTSISMALGIDLRHKTTIEMQREIGDERWANAYKFSCVRNPWSKVVSHYHYRMRTNQTSLKSHPIEFNEWVKLAYEQKDSIYFDKHNKKMFMQQADWLINKNGEIEIDFIARFENLQNDFLVITDELGVKAKLPHLKRSSHGNYRDYYTEETADIIKRHFAKDIELFNYEF